MRLFVDKVHKTGNTIECYCNIGLVSVYICVYNDFIVMM